MKNIIFDIDRTLVDSYYSEMVTLRQAIKDVTNIDVSDEHMKKLPTMVTADFFELIGINIESDIYHLINKRWGELLEKNPTRCFSGVKELIRELYENKFFLGIITSRNLEEFHELDEEFKDIIDCFSIIITSDMVSNPKPYSDSINLFQRKHNIELSETVYIGDGETDLEFSNNSGINFIQAAWDNDKINGCLYADSIDTLKNILLNNLKFENVEGFGNKK